MRQSIFFLFAFLQGNAMADINCLDAYWYEPQHNNVLMDSVYFKEINSGIANDWGWKYSYVDGEPQFLINDSYDGEGPDTVVISNSLLTIPDSGTVLFEKNYLAGDTSITDNRVFSDGKQLSKSETKRYGALKTFSYETESFFAIDTMKLTIDSIYFIDHSSYPDSIILEYIVKESDHKCHIYNQASEVIDSVLITFDDPRYAFIVEEGDNPRRTLFYKDRPVIIPASLRALNRKPIKIPRKKYDLSGRKVLPDSW